MTPEANFIEAIKKGFKKQRILLQRLEVTSGVGVPDCMYAMEELPGAGFIEVKRLKEWPKRESTIVRLKHFSHEQKSWMALYGPFIKRVFLLIQISRTYLLFPWTAVKRIGEMNRTDLMRLADESGGLWVNRIDYAKMKEILRRNCEKEVRPNE